MNIDKNYITKIEKSIFEYFGVPKELLQNNKSEIENQYEKFRDLNRVNMDIDWGLGKDSSVYMRVSNVNG